MENIVNVNQKVIISRRLVTDLEGGKCYAYESNGDVISFFKSLKTYKVMKQSETLYEDPSLVKTVEFFNIVVKQAKDERS